MNSEYREYKRSELTYTFSPRRVLDDEAKELLRNRYDADLAWIFEDFLSSLSVPDRLYEAYVESIRTGDFQPVEAFIESEKQKPWRA
jgi:hypothetical protein